MPFSVSFFERCEVCADLTRQKFSKELKCHKKKTTPVISKETSESIFSVNFCATSKKTNVSPGTSDKYSEEIFMRYFKLVFRTEVLS
jgi:hypothetical protein